MLDTGTAVNSARAHPLAGSAVVGRDSVQHDGPVGQTLGALQPCWQPQTWIYALLRCHFFEHAGHRNGGLEGSVCAVECGALCLGVDLVLYTRAKVRTVVVRGLFSYTKLPTFWMCSPHS